MLWTARCRLWMVWETLPGSRVWAGDEWSNMVYMHCAKHNICSKQHYGYLINYNDPLSNSLLNNQINIVLVSNTQWKIQTLLMWDLHLLE